MTKPLLLFLLLGLSLSVFDACSADGAKGGQSLYFEVSLSHDLTGEKLRQQVAVQENSSFSVVTTVGKVRWTVAGKVGVLREGIIPVDLTVKYYVSEDGHETSTVAYKLEIDKEGHGQGLIHGVITTPSIWTKPRQ
jgi:hypothetical protein